ncbi:MAG: choice-of-anchor L domain-containing protein [Chitinophagaceae bacterium]
MKIIKQIKKTVALLILFVFNAMSIFSQITITGSQLANTLAQSLVGTGVTISNPTLNCPAVSNGTFVVTPPNVTNLGLQSGIVLTSGTAQTTATAQGANGPATGPSTNTNGNGDADLTTLVGGATFDACILEFDFVPLGDTVKFEYVFGSSEYPSFTCTNFNDVFGFFISGPGIAGPYSNASDNIALVPGSTTCPVGVSTIYCPNNPGCCNTTNTNCFGNTVGCSMFNAANNTCAYFVCNAAGASVNYQGFTVPLTATAVVIPCSTYHLKLAIADKGDHILDSGVFLKEGSLSSNAISFTPISNLTLPYPYIVEGCSPGFVKVQRPVATPFPYTINYQLGGVASYPADYSVSSIPAGSPVGQITIPANDTVAYIVLGAIQDNIAEPNEEIKIYQLAPCTSDIIDSVSLFISDTIHMNIITPDTAICKEDSVHIQVNGDDSLIYSWTPITNINNPNIKEPTVSPNQTTNYVVCATLPQSGCAPKCDTIKISINLPPAVNIGADTIICRNQSIQYNPIISPNQVYTYQWSGSALPYLNGSSTVANPSATFTQVGDFQFILQVDPIAIGCQGDDTMNIKVLPDDIILFNGDTVVCEGATIPINVQGDPLFAYQWLPTTYLNNPNLEDPISNPLAPISYTVTATYPGCIPMSKSFDIDVQPVPEIFAGLDREMCDWDSVQLHVIVDPASYPNYTYSWAPNADLTSGSNTANPVFAGHTSTNLEVIVSTPIGCVDTDNVIVTVHPTEFATITPEEAIICPGDSVIYTANGAQSYYWTPSTFLSDTLGTSVVSTPFFPIEYTVYARSLQGCTDTEKVAIQVVSDAVIDAGEDVTLYPGETYSLNPQGNCSFFTWLPNYHLTNNLIKNPIADPPVSTQYIVYGTTEYGCKTSDTLTIRISEESILALPNAFSPGSGTSINDELKIIVKGIATLNYFNIYNRWGEKVFSTNDISKGWNGQYNGKPQPMGTYVYTLDAKTSTGKRITKTGNISLIR